MHKHQKGFWAEVLTLLYYICKFHTPLKHRYKVKVGEIDLIVKRGSTLVFIEVKARSIGIHENIVSITQQQRITRAAQVFIARHKQYQNCDIRFDLAVVKPYTFPQIIKNAW